MAEGAHVIRAKITSIIIIKAFTTDLPSLIIRVMLWLPNTAIIIQDVSVFSPMYLCYEGSLIESVTKESLKSHQSSRVLIEIMSRMTSDVWRIIVFHYFINLSLNS